MLESATILAEKDKKAVRLTKDEREMLLERTPLEMYESLMNPADLL